jgi:hypothetical protein
MSKRKRIFSEILSKDFPCHYACAPLFNIHSGRSDISDHLQTKKHEVALQARNVILRIKLCG